MSNSIYSLQVELPLAGDRSYPIVIGHGLLDDGERFTKLLGDSPVVLVSNDTVAPLYLSRVREALGKGRKVTEVILPDGEDQKQLISADKIWQHALKDHHERRSVFIALGGGVIGDLTGYSAACFLRGVDFIQLPTTLLAQVDSSVGGKTGVNHPLGKNMIGAFYQPQAVLIDINTLHTLPARELSAGLAEVVKYGLISDEPFYRWLQENMSRLLAREEAALAEAIQRSCANKAEVVAADEREGGLRALLNLGHTFGHAIETAQGYGRWLHGEAVAVGMLLALDLSARRRWIPAREVSAFRDLLVSMHLPTDIPVDMGEEQFLSLMGRDKKVIDGTLRLVLLREIGEACIVDDASREELHALLRAAAQNAAG